MPEMKAFMHETSALSLREPVEARKIDLTLQKAPYFLLKVPSLLPPLLNLVHAQA